MRRPCLSFLAIIAQPTHLLSPCLFPPTSQDHRCSCLILYQIVLLPSPQATLGPQTLCQMLQLLHMCPHLLSLLVSLIVTTTIITIVPKSPAFTEKKTSCCLFNPLHIPANILTSVKHSTSPDSASIPQQQFHKLKIKLGAQTSPIVGGSLVGAQPRITSSVLTRRRTSTSKRNLASSSRLPDAEKRSKKRTWLPPLKLRARARTSFHS